MLRSLSSGVNLGTTSLPLTPSPSIMAHAGKRREKNENERILKESEEEKKRIFLLKGMTLEVCW